MQEDPNSSGATLLSNGTHHGIASASAMSVVDLGDSVGDGVNLFAYTRSMPLVADDQMGLFTLPELLVDLGGDAAETMYERWMDDVGASIEGMLLVLFSDYSDGQLMAFDAASDWSPTSDDFFGPTTTTGGWSLDTDDGIGDFLGGDSGSNDIQIAGLTPFRRHVQPLWKRGLPGERWLKRMFKRGIGQFTFTTPLGVRRVDDFDASSGTIREVKTGKADRGEFIDNQVDKDVYLRANDPRVKNVHWYFKKSPTTGELGPTPRLRKFLEDNNIKIVIEK